MANFAVWTSGEGENKKDVTFHVGDTVRISNPLLGALQNEVGWCDEVPPWTHGIRAFWGNVESRTGRARGE